MQLKEASISFCVSIHDQYQYGLFLGIRKSFCVCVACKNIRLPLPIRFTFAPQENRFSLGQTQETSTTLDQMLIKVMQSFHHHHHSEITYDCILRVCDIICKLNWAGWRRVQRMSSRGKQHPFILIFWGSILKWGIWKLKGCLTVSHMASLLIPRRVMPMTSSFFSCPCPLFFFC